MSREFSQSVLLALLVTALAGGCANVRPLAVDTRLVTAAPAASQSGVDGERANETSESSDDVETGSRPPLTRLDVPGPEIVPPTSADLSSTFSDKTSVAVAADSMPVRNFINYIFGDVLKVSYVIVDGTPGLEQTVTLNTPKPVTSRQLFRMAGEVLASRGIGVVRKENVYFLGPVDGVTGGGTMPIGYGSRPQDVPNAPGNIFHVLPVKYGVTATLERTIRELAGVKLSADLQQSVFFLTGSRDAILKAIDVVRLLDQPSVRTSTVGLINLSFVPAKEFCDQLVLLLTNEGIPAGINNTDTKNVVLVPLEQLGAVAVFASSAELLNRVEFWAKTVDRPNQGPSRSYFIYQPKFARASDLGESLGPLLGLPSNGAGGNQSRDTRSAIVGQSPSASGVATPGNALRRDAPGSSSSAGSTGTAVAFQGEGLTLAIDTRSNSLIFYTTGTRYESLLPMIRRLDVPPKQILLEATIAEVSLTGDFAYGVEFAFSKQLRNSSSIDEFVDGGIRPLFFTPSANEQVSGGTAGGIGLPSGGLALNYLANATDEIRLRLSSSDGQVNVLSKPLLVVRDGVPATITVGNDVPTVGASASDPIESSRQITTVLYRRTGLDLSITPTINAQGLVVMQISQNISSTVPGSSGVAGAPIFFDRSVQTEVVARSGQSILLAGLISESSSNASSQVPGLGRLPGIGWLFSSNEKKRDKTELVLLITPRIIDGPDEWDTVRSGLEKALDHVRLDSQPR